MWNKKVKKLFKPPQQHTSTGIAANTTAGLPGELDARDDNPGPSHAIPQALGNPSTFLLETATPDVTMDGITVYRNESAEGHIGNTREEENEPVTIPRKRGHDFGGPELLATSTNPIEKGSDRFGSLQALLKDVSLAQSADPKEIAVVKKSVENLLPRVQTLEDHLGTRPNDIKDLRIREELRSKLKGLEGQLRSLYESQALQQRPDNSQGAENVFRVLDDLQQEILEYWAPYQHTIHERECRLMTQAESSALNSVRCAQDAEYRHGNRKGCLGGTRRTILDEIEIWSRDFGRPPVYWLNGLAGTGKSTIAQTIAERLSADGTLGASFFCSRDFEDRSDLRLIFPTLAVQLARKYTEFRSILVPLVQSDPGVARGSLYYQMEKLIVRPLEESPISTVIVIDALDECKDDEPASAILSVLGQFVPQFQHVKFFLTGRPEPHILKGFRLPRLVPETDAFVLHEVEPSQIKNDIRLFFKHELLEVASHLEDWPDEEQLDKLCERAGGLFVYAVAAVKFIGRKNSNPKKQLDRLLRSSEGSVLAGKSKFNADKTIDSLYMTILLGAFGDNDLEDDQNVRSILGAVVLAVNPLSPFAIATLLGFHEDDVFPPLASAHSLLVLHTDINKPVRPFHKSFPDFIIDPSRCSDSRFRVSPPDHHAELLVGCLKLLNQKLERNMCELPDGVINSAVKDLEDRIRRHIDGALQYACKSWHKHLAKAIPACKPDIVPMLHEFLERKFLFWLEVLSVLGAAREAVDALEEAAKWLDAPSTLDLVEDYSRFVVKFFDVIDTSAPHIYRSALLLSPKASIVRKLWGQWSCPLARVVWGLPSSWEPITATMRTDGGIVIATAWSPCGRFIAFAQCDPTKIGILDATTLAEVKTFTSDEIRRLSFSPDGRLLMGYGPELGFTGWDLQTGSPLGTIAAGPHRIHSSKFLSPAYSADGKAIAIAWREYDHTPGTTILTYNMVSSTILYSHRLEGRFAASIWTRGERLRIATVEPGSITIWEVDFTSTHELKVVETLPVPGEIVSRRILFHPSSSLFAFILDDTVRVWDVRNSKLLLEYEVSDNNDGMDFSPCCRFFTCHILNKGIRVWKRSAAGLYTPHQQLESGEDDISRPSFSPDGGSIICSATREVRLWHTEDPIPLSGVPNEFTNKFPFALEYCPDERLAAVARQDTGIVTIVDLKSGEPRLTIDTGMGVLSARVTGSSVVVVGEEKVVTWNLPSGGSTPGAKASLRSSVQTTMLDSPGRFPFPWGSSISPDLTRVARAEQLSEGMIYSLTIYDVSAGKPIGGIIPGDYNPQPLWFTPDGGEVWSQLADNMCGWAITNSNEQGLVEVDPIRPGVRPSGGLPWDSSRGYKITSDGWILSPSQERLLWLPHSWRSEEEEKSWKGLFLGLRHGGLPEAVILEFCE